MSALKKIKESFHNESGLLLTVGEVKEIFTKLLDYETELILMEINYNNNVDDYNRLLDYSKSICLAYETLRNDKAKRND